MVFKTKEDLKKRLTYLWDYADKNSDIDFLLNEVWRDIEETRNEAPANIGRVDFPLYISGSQDHIVDATKKVITLEQITTPEKHIIDKGSILSYSAERSGWIYTRGGDTIFWINVAGVNGFANIFKFI